MNLNELSKKRRTTKSYNNKSIDKKTLEYILDTAHNAPSSIGYESTRYLVFTRAKTREKIINLFGEYNRSKINECSHLVIFVTKDASVIKSGELKQELIELGKRKFDKVDTELANNLVMYVDKALNVALSDYVSDIEQAKSDWLAKQAYIQLGYMMLAAQEMGINSTPIEGFDYSKLRFKLQEMNLIKKNEFISVALLLGYGKEPMYFGKQTRKNISDIVKIID